MRKELRTFARILSRFVKTALTGGTILWLVLGLNWLGLRAIGDTASYFIDAEDSAGNVFRGAEVDFSIETVLDVTAPEPASDGIPEGESPGLLALPPVAPEAATTTEDAALDAAPDEPAPDAYIYRTSLSGGGEFRHAARVSSSSFSGELCDALTLTAFLNDAETYRGPLGGFLAQPVPFGGADAWRFAVSRTDAARSGICGFDFEFAAASLESPAEELWERAGTGYRDFETVHQVVNYLSSQISSEGMWEGEPSASATGIDSLPEATQTGGGGRPDMPLASENASSTAGVTDTSTIAEPPHEPHEIHEPRELREPRELDVEQSPAAPDGTRDGDANREPEIADDATLTQPKRDETATTGDAAAPAEETAPTGNGDAPPSSSQLSVPETWEGEPAPPAPIVQDIVPPSDGSAAPTGGAIAP